MLKLSAQSPTSRIGTNAVAVCFLLAVILHGGCKFPTEDPGALNSVQNYSTLQVRFVNLAADGMSRSFQAEYFAAGTPEMPPIVNYANISAASVPRFDSARVIVPISGTTVLDTTVIRFTGRNLVYTLIALPQVRPSGGSIEIVDPNAQTKKVRVPELEAPLRAVDTVLALSSSQDVIPAGSVRLRAVNCVYDSRHRFDLTVGCPSGEVIASGLPYRQASSYITTLAPSGMDSLTVSLITKPTTATVSGSTTPTSTLVIGSFKIPAKSAQSYSILIYRDRDKNVNLLPIHDFRSDTASASAGKAPSALLRVVNVSGIEPNAYIYRINGVDSDIAALRNNSTTPRAVSTFAELTACQSVGRDTIVTIVGGNRVNAVGALNAGSAYTLLVGRNTRKDPFTLIAPVLESNIPAGKARLRFVNFTPQPLFVMRGTTGASNDALFSSLPTGILTDAVLVNKGNLPLLLFNTTQPTQLLQTGIDIVESEKSYIVIFTAGTSVGDPPRISLVKDARDAQAATDVPIMPQGAFVQFMNARADNKTVALQFGAGQSGISSVLLYYGTPQMTAVQQGEYQKSNFSVEKVFITNKRKYALLFTGTDEQGVKTIFVEGMRDSAQLQPFANEITGSRDIAKEQTASIYRYINAAPDFAGMYVRTNPPGNATTSDNFRLASTATTNTRTTPLNYLDVTRVLGINQARAYDLIFKSTVRTGDSTIVQNLQFANNRAYSIIFSGRTVISISTNASMQTTTTSNYNAIILQEY